MPLSHNVIDWADDVSGPYSLASAWRDDTVTPAGPPGEDEIARFATEGAAYTVSGGGSAGRLELDGDTVNLSGTYEFVGLVDGDDTICLDLISGSLIMATDAQLYGGGSGRIGMSDEAALIINQDGRAGFESLEVGAYGSLILNDAAFLALGDDGDGEVLLGDGATMTTDGYGGIYGDIVMTDGSLLEIGGFLFLYNFGQQNNFDFNEIDFQGGTISVTGSNFQVYPFPIGFIYGRIDVTGEAAHVIDTAESDGFFALLGYLTGDGDLTISSGTTAAVSQVNWSMSGDLILEAGSQFVTAGVETESLTGAITGAGKIFNLSPLVLANPDNSYSGGTDLYSGILEVEAAGAAGSGAIRFTNEYFIDEETFSGGLSSATLSLESEAFVDGAFANVIYGLEAEDSIEIEMAYVSGARAVLSGDQLIVSSGDAQMSLTVRAAAGPFFDVREATEGWVEVVVLNTPPAPTDSGGNVPTPGDDDLTGSATADTIAAQAGADTVHGRADDDILYGNAGDDHLFGEGGNDTLFGGRDNDTLAGDAGEDRIYGNRGDDHLQGGDDDDQLFGGQGNDTLEGGAGDDWLQGGLGADRFEFDSGAGADTIRGFSADDGDRIGLSADDVTLSASDDGVIVSISGGGSILLLGVELPDDGSAEGWFAP